jgi:hydrogenase maturation protease
MQKKDKNKIIILGIGNIGRQDDGLGWLFLDFLKEEGTANTDIEYRYQLQIEDAELICHYNKVIFVDATKNNTTNGFSFEVCKPSGKFSFSTHALVPETILFLANKLYQHNPKAFVLGIQGYQWNLKNGLTIKANYNFDKAKAYFNEKISVDI